MDKITLVAKLASGGDVCQSNATAWRQEHTGSMLSDMDDDTTH